MKNTNNSEESADSVNKIRESSKKYDLSLKSNSSVYFQIGLILSLLASYALLEMKFKMQIPNFSIKQTVEDTDTFYLSNIIIEPDAFEQKKAEKRMALLNDKPPIIKPNDFVIKDAVSIVSPEANAVTAKLDVNTLNITPPIETLPKVFSLIGVEKVPVFPGCESAKNNEERMACMSEKLTKLIQKKFNTDLATDLGLTGLQRIQVQFTVDDTGRVKDIKTRSAYWQLQKESERVISKIPVMIPGMQSNIPVSVIYQLPISFQVN